MLTLLCEILNAHLLVWLGAPPYLFSTAYGKEVSQLEGL